MPVIRVMQANGHDVAVVEGEVIWGLQSAVDLLAKVVYELGCSRVIIPKEALPEEFFQLQTQQAGEILQKFQNYQAKVAIVGDFSMYASRSQRGFITESNRGQWVFFLANLEEALERLTQ